MAEFKSHESYRRFAESVATKWRYARNAEQTEFLQTVFATSASRQEVLHSGMILWRAQRDHSWRADPTDGGDLEEYPCAVRPERMKPKVNRASEGRANPRGIPYLYLATEEDTAIAEVRPWIGSYVSVAQFALRRELRVVNCVSDYRSTIIWCQQEPAPEVREQSVWRDIDQAFSQPVTLADDIAEYAPSQILAEFFREKGLDGVAYGSSLGDGHSVALFDPGVAKVLNGRLVRISKVKLWYSDEDNPYFVDEEQDPVL